MKLFHLSDLHLGIKLNEFSLYDDQKYILDKILELTEAERPDAVLIAGDVYDKSVPPAEAVRLFDSFLTRLAALGVPAFVISGNHDSAERLAFGARLMDASGVHIASAYDGSTQCYTLHDEYGPVHIYLLPFIKPLNVKRCVSEEEAEQIASYHDAVALAVGRMEADPDARNVLVAHQFVTGAQKCDSEDVSVGGLDNVGAEAFDGFCYVALGHIHSPQNLADGRVRYCGTPLKYSFSECSQTKSVTVAEIDGEGAVRLRLLELQPMRDLRKVRGTYDEVTLRENYINTNLQDFIHVTLLDEQDVPNALAKLRVIYPNLLQLEYDNLRTRGSHTAALAREIEKKSELELFGEFYRQQNNQPMSEEQRRHMRRLIGRLKGEEA